MADDEDDEVDEDEDDDDDDDDDELPYVDHGQSDKGHDKKD